MASSQVIVETKRTHTDTQRHTHLGSNKYIKNSPCAFQWKSSIHMAGHTHTVNVIPRGGGAEDANRTGNSQERRGEALQ